MHFELSGEFLSVSEAWSTVNVALLPTLLRLLHRVVGILQQLGDDRLDVLSYVTGLGERGAVADREGDVQTARQRLCQQRLSCNGRREDVVSGTGLIF